MRRTGPLLFICAALAAVSGAAANLEGVEIPASMLSAGTPLVLNGAGVRSSFFLDVYVAGLYLRQRSTNAAAIMDADEPMAIKLYVISALITRDRMRKSIETGFRVSTRGNTAPIRAQIDALKEAFTDEIGSGDVFDLAYAPGKGIVVSRNGTQKTTVASGLPFKRALFGIWLSDRAVQPSLRRELLGR